MRPRTVFRSLFSLLIRATLGERYGNGSYGASLDGLVQALNGMSERLVVPGRGYSSWGWRSLDEIRSQVLAMLVASLPPTSDDNVGQLLRDLAANEALFADGDASFRRIDSALKACAQALGEQHNQDLFDRGVHALAPEADTVAARASSGDFCRCYCRHSRAANTAFARAAH
jgi:hypothetical protein